VAGKAALILADKDPDSKDLVVWRWIKGADTDLMDFGDPLGTDAYGLCVYDAMDTLLLRAQAPAGGACVGKACWVARRQSFRYADRDGTPQGIVRVVLKAGVGGTARVRVKGKGLEVRMPELGALTLPLRVQLEREHAAPGQCWEATYSVPLRNDATQFKARSD
jgi:hypothetical protein